MASVGDAWAPPGHPLVPSEPPPPIPSPLQHRYQKPGQQQYEDQAVSRYRSLRGKSVSSVHRNKNKTFDVFSDAEDVKLEDHPALRRRSKSAISPKQQPTAGVLSLPTANANAKANANTANANASTTPLTSKSVNIPFQPSSTNVKSKLENTRPADLARLKALNKRSSRENLEATTPTKAAKPILKKKAHEDRVEEDEAEHWAEEVARLEAETDRILAEQKKRDLARLQAQLAAAASPKPKPKRLILDKLTFLTKGNRSNASSPATPTRSSPRSYPLVWSPGTTNFDGSISPDTMAFIEHGGAGGLVPQIDAPTSASNGGERRVTVRCDSATINLPVTPETSPRDIIYSTANLVSHQVDPSNCVLVEGYVMFGLERRLRNYEKIRDVMNSWDRDQQNALVVLSFDSPPDDRDLDLAYVPKTEDPPIGFTFQLYHSSRPGKWNKRWVTLMDTGQIFAAKHPDSKFTDKDGTALCHLSDFDIYTPKESETRRHLKAPKRFCYAIKSQQKTNVFPNGENWVHFFSTEDSKLAQRFHELIHGWRSWYLANKKVDLPDRAKQPGSSRTSGDTLKKSMSLSQKSHQSRLDDGEKPYTIGDFKPLIDMQRFDKPIEEFGKDLPAEVPPAEPEAKETTTPKTKTLSRTRTNKTVSSKAPSVPTSPQSAESEFLSGSLLGDAYEKRKQAETVTTQVKKIEGPFTEGPSLLNGGAKSVTSTPEKPEVQSWFPSAVEHTARHRSVSSPRGPPRRPMTADNAAHRHQQHPLLGYGYSNAQQAPPLPGRGAMRGPGNGRGVKAPPHGAPLIDLANGNPMPSGMPSRSNTRSSTAPGPGGAGGLINQPRRRATTTSSRSGQPLISGIRPPVPPLPDRSHRRPEHRVVSPSSSGRGQRPAEPLINRAK